MSSDTRRDRGRSRYRVMAAATTALLVAALGGCGSATKATSGTTEGTSSGTAEGGAQTLTYWASNQAPTLAGDSQVLGPELAKFTKQTGIKVQLHVISWNDLLNRILAATTSGQGPDVLNIGNTWAPSLQATGAFVPFTGSDLAAVGGSSRFLGPSFAATGAPGKPPTSIPLYGLAYGLFYNKAMFAAAGITSPPSTWAQFVTDGQKLTTSKTWGVALEGGSYTENAHFAFILGAQHGAHLFNSSGQPTFTSPQEVAAVKQYVDFLAKDKIASPSDAEYSNGTEAIHDFATGKAAMLMWQNNATASLAADGMSSSAYGVAPIPFLDPVPPGGQHVDSHVAGINISVFKDTKDLPGALKLVKFLTSTSEQQILNKAFGSLPVVKDAYEGDPTFSTPVVKVFQGVLADSAAPLPEVADESQFETTVGTAMKTLFAQAAAGTPLTDASVQAALSAAQQQMTAGSSS